MLKLDYFIYINILLFDCVPFSFLRQSYVEKKNGGVMDVHTNNTFLKGLSFKLEIHNSVHGTSGYSLKDLPFLHQN